MATLPQLDQTEFASLKDAPQKDWTKKLLVPQNSTWGNVENEFMAGALTTACLLQGQWVAVPESHVFEIMSSQTFLVLDPEALLNGWAALIEGGDVQIVESDGVRYAVPTPRLSRIVMGVPKLGAVSRMEQASS